MTYVQLYGALSAFLNGKALEAEVMKRIKTLDERVIELDEKIIPEKKAIHSRKSTALISSHLNLSQKKVAVSTAKTALSEAESATATAKADVTSAKAAVKTSVSNENQAYLVWWNYKRDNDYSESDDTEVQLRSAWEAAKKQLAEDRKALEDAKSALKKCKKAETEAESTLWNAERSLSLNGPYIEQGISELEIEVPGLQTEIDNLETELEEKREELEKKKTRLAEIVASYPTVSAYMTAFVNASITEGSAFDINEYIKENPPPSIIFDSE